MEIISRKTSIPFLGYRHKTAIVSSILLVLSIGSLVSSGLLFGVDFTGGTVVEISYPQSVSIERVRGALIASEIEDASIQYFGSEQDILVKLPSKKNQELSSLSNQILASLRSEWNESFVHSDSGLDFCTQNETISACVVQLKRVEFVGPQVGEELVNKGGLAVIYALIGILIYIAFRFEWRFAIGAISALIHDVLITIGFFSILQVEFDLSVLAAVLAVIGYSLNDTIVVYDRIRENFYKIKGEESDYVINASVNQTMPRTILTSLTTLFVVLSLLFFGGEAIFGFALTLFIGIIIGTYSSIFVASPIVFLLGVSRLDMLPVQKEGLDSNINTDP